MKQKVLITGATSGLGLSHAVFLQSKGYEVTGLGRSIPNLEVLAERFRQDNSHYSIQKGQIKRKGERIPVSISENLVSILSQIKFKICDITDSNSLDRFFSDLQVNWRSLDFLINNSGFGLFGSVLQMDLEKERKQFDLNVLSQLEFIRRSMPLLLKSNSAKIINTASLAAYFGIPYQGHYSSSKAAIHNLTESLRHEVKPLGIQVTTIDPGDINTSFNAHTVSETVGTEVGALDFNGLIASFQSQAFPEYLTAQQRHELMKRELRVWKTIVKNLLVAPPPLVVSRQIEKILRKRKLKPHYKVGSRFQVLAVSVAQRIFSDNFSNFLISRFYGL